MFPILQSGDRDFIKRSIMDVASPWGHFDVDSALKDLCEANYWRVPDDVLDKELTRLRAHIISRANAIRQFCDYPELEVPARQGRPDLPPAA